MATLKKTADGKVDKRTKEYKELVERAKQARLAKARTTKTTKSTTQTTTASKATTTKKPTTTAKKPATTSVKRRSDGKVDLRTKEGKAIAEKMAKARASKAKPQTGIAGLLKKLLK